MPTFPKPSFPFAFDAKQEIAALRKHKAARGIPAKAPGALLLATWNLANLGAQDREERHYRLIAEILSWFDLIAIQECREDLTGLRAIQKALGPGWRALFTDPAGNDERLTFLFDPAKISTGEMVGELALAPADLRNVKLPGISQPFEGFDRCPFLQSFIAGKFHFTLANVHNYFGDDSPEKMQRRQLETFALARWAKRQSASDVAYHDNVILLGDFNLPLMELDDPIYSILIKHGLLPIEHATQVGTTLRPEDANSAKAAKQYDQIAFFPQTSPWFTKATGVFDYDQVLFEKLFKTRKFSEFNAYLRYYISDHRPLWAKFRC